MNISKDGKTLYFSDDEIENTTNGEKKVYVTKRINGKESHSKIEKEQNKRFDFSNEIVIGVTPRKQIEKKEPNTQKITRNNKSNKLKKKNNHAKKDKIETNEVNNTDTKKNKRKKAKKTKRKRASKKLISIFSCLLLIGVIAVFAFTTPIFNITKIEVNGNSQVSNDTIISMSGLKKGENIFKFNNSIIQNIKENQYIEEVKIDRKLPGTINISINERNIKYQIKLINSYAYIDKNGYILEISSIKKEVPVIVGLKVTENDLINKKRLDVQDLEKLNKIQKVIDAAKSIEIDNIITEINIENDNDYYIYIESQNKKIYIGNTNNLPNKMLYVKKILEEEKEQSGTGFVNGDIGSGFKPYFRPE